MAVIRFTLDGPSTLNDSAFGLDGFSPPFILNTSVLDGNGLLDGAEFLTTATGAATLGAISATATSTVTHIASASAELGGLVAEIAEVIVTTQATAEAQLGGLVSLGSATVIHSATLSASLGGLVATAITAVAQNAVATAELGGLVATVNSIPTPPEPTPEPTPTGGRQYAAPRRRKKVEPEPVVEPVIIEPKRRFAVTSAKFGGINARAESTITFSILDDDAEVLLLV